MNVIDGQQDKADARWGERPSGEQQAALERTLDAWASESDHGDRSGAFSGEPLTGADVFWLAVLAYSSPDRPVDETDQALREGKFLQFLSISTGALHLEGANLIGAHLEGANLFRAHLEGANLFRAHLEGAYLRAAHLERAYLRAAHLERANLTGAQLEGASLVGVHLEGATLNRSIFDIQTNLADAIVGSRDRGFVSVADVAWNGVNLAVVRWSDLLPKYPMVPFSPRGRLGDDVEAQKTGEVETQKTSEYDVAARANRQLALALRAQGLTTEAAELDYRAHVWERKTYWPRNIPAWLGSWLICLTSGYGYRLGRSLALYIGTIVVFWRVYLAIPYPDPTTTTIIVRNTLKTLTTPHHDYLSWQEALIMSVTSFHGRGFFPSQITGSIGHGMAAAVEAFIGLLIEATLIATFTQRIFR